MPEASLSILVIDENQSRAAIIEEALREAGHSNVVMIRETAGVVRRIEEVEPDVIVIDLENPNRDALESMFHMSRSIRRPVAMFVDRSDASMIEAAIDAGVSAYVVDGLKKERVKPILDMAILRFKAFAKLRDELDTAKRALADRKIIDRAKGLLMRARGASESDAYELMRITAMNENRRLADVARSIVTAAALLKREAGE